MCLMWFGCAYLFSTGEAAKRLYTFYLCGGPLLNATWLEAATIAVVTITALVTIAFVVHDLRMRSRGRSASPIKLLLMAITFSYFWFCMTSTSEAIIGVALFEVFHDVQYLTIVWVFTATARRKIRTSALSRGSCSAEAVR